MLEKNCNRLQITAFVIPFFLFALSPAAVTLSLYPGMDEIQNIYPSRPLSWTTTNLQEPVARRGLALESEIKYQWVTQPGGTIRVHVFSAGLPLSDKGRLLIWDWRGIPVLMRDYTAPFDEWVEFSIQGNGVYLMTLDAIDSADVWQSRLIRSVAALENNGNKINVWNQSNDYFIGSCIFPTRYGSWGSYAWPDLSPAQARQKINALARFAGLQVLRIDYPASDPFSTNTLDPIVSEITNQGMKVSFKIAAKPGYCYGISNVDWTNKLRTLVSRYQNGAKLFEIGNEPVFSNFFPGSREEYQQLLFQARSVIKKVGANNLVVNGGMCNPAGASGGEGNQGSNFYSNFLREAGTSNDYLAYHFHEDLASSGWIQDMRQQMSQSGVPFVQTEGGRCPWRVDKDSSAAAELIQKIFWSWAQKDMGWQQYSLLSGGAGGNGALWGGDDNSWAMVEESVFAPRFLYGTLGAMIRQFAGYQSGGHLFGDYFPTKDVYTCAFSNASNQVLAFWSLKNSSNAGLVYHNGTSAKVVDEMGNVLSTSGVGPVAIRAGNFPRWVICENAKTAKVLSMAGYPSENLLDITFDHLPNGKSLWTGAIPTPEDLDETVHQADSCLWYHNRNCLVTNLAKKGNAFFIGTRWGGYAESDVAFLNTSLDELTISLWVQINRWHSNYLDNTAFWSLESDREGSIALLTGVGEGRPALRAFSGGVTGVPYVTSPWGLGTNWTLLTTVLSKSNNSVKIYHQTNLAVVITGYNPLPTTHLKRVRVGNRFDSTSYATRGAYDNARVYRKALNASDILALWQKDE